MTPSSLLQQTVKGALITALFMTAITVKAANPGTVVAWGFNGSGQTTVPASLNGVTAIAAGYGHTVALKSDGTVLAWGLNNDGQTTAPVGLSGMTAIAAGAYHTVALRNDGTVLAWGDNSDGQTTVPAGLTGVTAIAAGGSHTVVLKSDGTVRAWGFNGYGQTTVPAGLSGVMAIAAGGYHTLALKSDGTVVAWGYNNYGQTTVPVGLSGVVAIAAGEYHTVALRSDGTVVAWGYNNYSQTSVPAGLSGVVAIATGDYHTVALKSNGTVQAWGDNGYGQTTLPPGLNGVTAIAAGFRHTVALVPVPQPIITQQPGSLTANVTSNPTFSMTATGIGPLGYQWRKDGVNVSGATSASLTLSNVQANQAGDYTVVVTNAYGSVTSSVAVLTVDLHLAQTISFAPVPTKRLDEAPFTLNAMANSGLPVSYTSFNPGVATVSGNTVTIMGIGTTIIMASQAGDATYLPAANVGQALRVALFGPVVAWGDNYYGQTNIPAGLIGVTAIAPGYLHTVALKSDGTVVAWGINDGSGQTSVPGGLSGVVAIAAGNNHSVALKSDGTVVAWGKTIFIPVGLSEVVAIAAGDAHAMALKSDGTVVAWGYNHDGQTTVPGGLSGVVAIAAGANHSVALKSDGTVQAWGNNNDGQTSVPAGLSGVVAIAAGATHIVALKSNGTVQAWGGNGAGQTTVPAGVIGVTAIAAGRSHTVALKSDGTVRAWGFNGYGQTTVPAGLSGVVAIAAGGFHTAAIVGLPSVTAQPQNFIVNATSNVTFSVTALGMPPLSYQWRKDGVNVAGATNASLTWSNVQTNETGSYAVVITNVFGSVTSSNGLLTVNRLAQAISFGSLPSMREDEVSFTLNAMANSGLPVSYTSFNPGVATVSGNTVRIRGIGSTSITASQAGDATYLPAASVSQTLCVGLVAWGNNTYGQTTIPVGLSGVTAIAAGEYHTVALQSNGTVVAWGVASGFNNHGQTTVPAGLSGVVAIAAGGSHTVVLKSDGTVQAWGFNGYGQTTAPAGLSGVVAIAAGASHTVALKGDGTVVAWGYNVAGQTTIPAGLSGVTAIAAGAYHTVALRSDGTVQAWGGYNNYGETTVPVGLGGVTAIAAGANHTVALKSDGTVVVWGVASGYNYYGQTTVPAGLSGVVAIAAGGEHTVALKSDGTVVAWGYNGWGQTTIPAGLSGVTAIAAGANHTVALMSVPLPTITAQLQSQTVAIGASVSFTVVATGALPLSYQWRKSGSPIPSATSATFALTSVQLADASTYDVVVANAVGAATSSAATLVVTTNSYANRVLSLSGMGQYASIPSSSAIQPSNAITIELWFLPLPPAPGVASPVVLDKGDGQNGNSARSFQVNWSPSSVVFELFLGTSTYASIGAPAPVSTWIHFAATYDSATSRISIFTNGILAASTTNNASGSPVNGAKIRQTTLPLTLGLIPGLNTYFNGSLDEVRVWNFARSGAEIFRDFHARLAGTEPGLVGYWQFDGGTVADLTTNANNGSLAGGAQIVAITGADIPHIGAPTIPQLSQNLAVAPGSNVTFTVAATSIATLSYQWFKDGVLIADQTNAQLNLSSLTNRARGGSFSVVVSNLYGAITGNIGSIRVRVPHRLQPPVATNGMFRLLSADQDGGLLTTNDLAFFTFQTSTNLTPTNWLSITYTNGLSLTNGMLRFDDTNAASRPFRYYRVIEQ